jgi:GT2 family glycosyltransferase
MIYILFAIHNRKAKTLKCLECIRGQTYKNYRVVIFDDGSTDGSSEEIKKRYPKAKILFGDGNCWWSKSMNRGLKYILKRAKADDYVLTLNDDTTFDINYLQELYQAARANPDSCIGTILRVSPSQYEGPIRIDWRKYQYQAAKIDRTKLNRLPKILKGADTLSCRGALIPVKAFRTIGVFEEKKLPHYAADYEFFLRARKNNYSLLLASRAVTQNNSPGSLRERKRAVPGLGRFLFGRKSPWNIQNHLVIISRYCPGLFLKFLNFLRVIIGLPISYFLKKP